VSVVVPAAPLECEDEEEEVVEGGSAGRLSRPLLPAARARLPKSCCLDDNTDGGLVEASDDDVDVEADDALLLLLLMLVLVRVVLVLVETLDSSSASFGLLDE
jgi:hypothetical protein